jgi:DNA-binding NarL/FixJ family response regulator
MSAAAPQDRSHVQLEQAALSVAWIASSESVARTAAHALSRGGLVLDGHYLGSGPAAVERIAPGTDVVLVMEDGPRLATVVRAARLRAPDAGIVVVVAVAAPTETRRLLAAGADALVLEDETEEVLPAAVLSAAVGQISVPRPLRNALEPPTLSYRDLQIVALAATGCTNAQIAERLCLAEGTIKAHLSSVFRRLGVGSRREAAAALLASDDEFLRSILHAVRPTVPAGSPK